MLQVHSLPLSCSVSLHLLSLFAPPLSGELYEPQITRLTFDGEHPRLSSPYVTDLTIHAQALHMNLLTDIMRRFPNVRRLKVRPVEWVEQVPNFSCKDLADFKRRFPKLEHLVYQRDRYRGEDASRIVMRYDAEQGDPCVFRVVF